mgnify:CR=1 FL=1
MKTTGDKRRAKKTGEGSAPDFVGREAMPMRIQSHPGSWVRNTSALQKLQGYIATRGPIPVRQCQMRFSWTIDYLLTGIAYLHAAGKIVVDEKTLTEDRGVLIATTATMLSGDPNALAITEAEVEAVEEQIKKGSKMRYRKEAR